MLLPGSPQVRLPLAALLAAACTAGVMLSPAHAASAPVDHDRALHRQLRELTEAPGGPPGVIAVLEREHRTEVFRAGVADTGTARPIRTTDHMRIASTAKAYSGAVALQLVDRGDCGWVTPSAGCSRDCPAPGTGSPCGSC